MARVVRPNYNAEDLGVNPFVSTLSVKVREIVLSRTYKSQDGVLLPINKDLEKDPFCKLYCSQDRREMMGELGLRSKELLLWIMQEIDPGDDHVWINKTRYMEEMKISALNTYRAALRDLVTHGLIATTIISNVYWINPHFFFKGDRVSKFSGKLDRV